MKIIEKGNGTNGNWIRVGNVRDIGVKDIDRFIKNLNFIYKQSEKARKAGFHIESISLDLQIIDFWLRTLVYWNEKKKIKLRVSFRETMNKSKKYINPNLYQKLVKFNRKRIKAIHHYVYGHGDYTEIIKTSNEFIKLPIEVGNLFLNTLRTVKQVSTLSKTIELPSRKRSS